MSPHPPSTENCPLFHPAPLSTAKEGTQLSPPHCSALTSPPRTTLLTPWMHSHFSPKLSTAGLLPFLFPKQQDRPAGATSLPWGAAREEVATGCGWAVASHRSTTQMHFPLYSYFIHNKIKAQTVPWRDCLSQIAKAQGKKDREHSKHAGELLPNIEHPCAYPKAEQQFGKHMAEHKAFLPALSSGPSIKAPALDSTQV